MDLLESLIPHRRTLKLIENIEDTSKDNFLSSLVIKEDSFMYTDSGVPSFCSLEYMAQTIAAYNAYHYSNNNEAKIGFIVSIRKLFNTISYFELGTKLTVNVNPVLIVKNTGNFDCSVFIDGQKVSSAKITAYLPTSEELEEFKNGK